MATFTIGAAELDEIEPSDFEQFVALAKGRSVVSAADWGSDRFELGLSGNAMIRISRLPAGLEINLISTTNPGEIPPLVFALGDLPQRVRLSLVERKLYGLRTLYAIYFLAQHDRMEELVSFLKDHPDGDLEATLLSDEETLQVESISYGSWLVTLGQRRRVVTRPSVPQSASSLSGAVRRFFKNRRPKRGFYTHGPTARRQLLKKHSLTFKRGAWITSLRSLSGSEMPRSKNW